MVRLALCAFPLLVTMTSCKPAQDLQAVARYDRKLTRTSAVDTTETKVTGAVDAQGRKAHLISAFFGLDNKLPRPANFAICPGAYGADGMPVIFSHEVDVDTVDPGDFKVARASGELGKILCVTLAPADDEGELRTVLLAGEYGSVDDPPVKVEIVGNLLAIDGSVNFQGASAPVTRLEDGPTIVLAEVVPPDRFGLGKQATDLVWGGGTGCPRGTKQIVNVVWNGGVTKPGGDEVDDVERILYRVTVVGDDGDETSVTPFALGDIKDGDNNHRLCLDVEGTPKSVFFPAGHLTDPNEDLNPETRLAVTDFRSSEKTSPSASE